MRPLNVKLASAEPAPPSPSPRQSTQPSETRAPTYPLPYDITEGPVAPPKTDVGGENHRHFDDAARRRNLEYPLVFDNRKWRTFHRSAYLRQRQQQQQRGAVTATAAATASVARENSIFAGPHTKKFFDALVKPRVSRTSYPARQILVFRDLDRS